MNPSIPLLALLMANRLGDSSSDSGRVALLAMTIRPAMMGLLVALMVAKQRAKTTNAVVSNSTVGGKASGAGPRIVNQVIPKADHSFFPTFIDLSRKEAAQQAKKLGLSATFVDSQGASGRDMVVAQDPKPGSNWPRNVAEVTLYLG